MDTPEVVIVVAGALTSPLVLFSDNPDSTGATQRSKLLQSRAGELVILPKLEDVQPLELLPYETGRSTG